MKETTDSDLLHLTLAQMDIIDLNSCFRIWKICEGRQFVCVPPSVFACFLNLRSEPGSVKIREREKLRVCYLIYFISENIVAHTISQQWKAKILDLCEIEAPYYKSHYRDAVAAGTSRDNKDFVENLEGIFEKNKDTTT